MTKPQSQDLSRFLSDEANSRNPSVLKEAFVHSFTEGMTSLGGGLPLPSMFSWDDMRIKALAPPFKQGIDADITKADDTIEINVTKPKGTNDQDVPLNTSLQYGQSQGDHRLLGFIDEHTRIVHDIGFEDWGTVITSGNTFAWDAVLRTFTNRGDTILCEEFSFASALETAHAQGVKTVGVKMDLHGIIPEALDLQLSQWVGAKPKFLYTIPTGQNPTGSCVSAERRKAIYDIIKKHDLLLIEDEPYYFLQMPEYEYKQQPETLTHEQFLKSLVPSYLHFDTDGRVLRLDSFSKVLAPGSRIGWIVAQKRFLERLTRLMETSSQGVSGFSSTAVNGLLQRWGQKGYIDWLIELRLTYTHKRNIVCDAITEILPKGTHDLCPPVAGMFFWLKYDGRRHKLWNELKDPKAVEMKMYEEGLKELVQLIPGQWFVANQITTPPQPEVPRSDEEKAAIYYRGTFASVPADKLVEAIKKWARVVEHSIN